MPRFALTFEYPDRLGAKATGSQTVTRETLQDAAEYIATQRGLASIHIRTCNGEAVEREFTFGPSGKAEAA
jgi:hypothetical protein